MLSPTQRGVDYNIINSWTKIATEKSIGFGNVLDLDSLS